MRVTGISGTSSGMAGFEPRRRDPQPVEKPAPGRALVALAPVVAPKSVSLPVRGTSAFIAQLIAGKDQHPQTRAKRRAEPLQASHVYAAALAANPAAASLVLSRKI